MTIIKPTLVALANTSQVANPSVAALYEDALVYETGTAITSSGALTAYSGAKTGRSPSDKRVVQESTSEKDIWWGPVNKPMTPEVCSENKIPHCSLHFLRFFFAAFTSLSTIGETLMLSRVPLPRRAPPLQANGAPCIRRASLPMLVFSVLPRA